MNDAYHVHVNGESSLASAGTYRLQNVTFDAATGNVTCAGDDRTLRTTRLAPKPAALLNMLIEKHGELLSMDEIRAALWPDVQVEFDQGVHTCIRQIRAALGDSATMPTFIETLPRRGYRLLIEPELENDTLSPARPHFRPWRIRAVAALAIVIIAIIATLSVMRHTTDPISLAIMPFDPPADSTLTNITDAATMLVEQLGSEKSFAVIGPSTTVKFSTSDSPLSDAISELNVAFVINARFIQRDGRDQVLMELIRASDGAHVWVKMYDETSDAEQVADEVARKLRAVLLQTGDSV